MPRVVDAQAQVHGRIVDQVGLDAETLQQREDRGELLFQHEGEIPRPDGQQHLVLLEDQDRNVDRGRHASDHRAGFALVAEGPHVKRNILVLKRLDRLRMDDLRAAVSQFDGVEVVQLGDLHGIGKRFRVGVHHAVHILPHRHRLGVENVGHHGRRVVRAFAPQGRGRAVGRAADEALSHEDRLRRTFHFGQQAECRGVDIDRSVLVALLRDQCTAHVDPMVGHSRRGEVLRDDGRRKQFAEGDDRVVPQLGVGRTVLRLGGDAIQFGEQRLDPFQTGRAVPEVVDDRGVIFAQPCDLGSGFFAVAPLHPLEHPFQRIGRLAHRRDDDEEVLFVVDDIAQVAHPLSIADRCSAEFIDLHILVSRFTLFEPSCCSTAHGRCADTNIPSPLSPPFDKGRGLRRIGLHLFHPAPRQSADRYPDALLIL